MELANSITLTSGDAGNNTVSGVILVQDLSLRLVQEL